MDDPLAAFGVSLRPVRMPRMAEINSECGALCGVGCANSGPAYRSNSVTGGKTRRVRHSPARGVTAMIQLTRACFDSCDKMGFVQKFMARKRAEKELFTPEVNAKVQELIKKL